MRLDARARSFTWDQPTAWVALIAALACVVPLVGFLWAWHQQVDLGRFTAWGTVPALVVLGVCEAYLVRRSPLMFNRLASGLLGGLAAVLAFDLVRLPAAYFFKGAPDWVPLVGQYLVDDVIGIAPTARAVGLGYGYHYLLIGALLGATYSLLMGRGRWYWAAASALVLGVGFTSLPQFRLLTVASGFELPLATVNVVVAFAVAGAVLGLVVRALGRTAANVLYVVFAREDVVEAPEFVAGGRY